MLRDNFKDGTEVQGDVTLRDGQTLREALTNDCHREKEGEHIVRGKHYYQEFRQKYVGGPFSGVLKVLDYSESVGPRLEKAIAGALAHVRNFVPLTEWLETAGRPTQRNLVALSKAYIRTYNLDQVFPNEVRCMNQHFDRTLQKSLGICKHHKVSSMVWWESVSDFAGLVLPVEAVGACMR